MKKKQHFADLQWSGIKKLIIVMKLTVFFLFLSVMSIAAGTYGQETRFDLNVKDATIIQLFDEIEHVTEFGFLFKTDQLDLNRHYTLDLKQANIDQILNEVLDKGQYNYTVIDRNIVITRVGENATKDGKPKTVSGKVTDSSGATLPGVSVVVKGTIIGVTTDFNGNYSLSNIPENAILQFSFVGMKAQEVKVGNQATMNVVLVEETVALDEVVAIGYGTQKKGNLTGSVSQIKSEALQERAITGLGEAFAGQIAGVRAQQVSGRPGAELTIQMRGISSVTSSNKPLYVIDGTPTSDIQDFNPNDIASIEVLKDASSAAIYGARGSGGVVLISTKKGSGKPIFSFESYYGLQQVDKLLPMMNRDQFIAFSKYQADLLYIRSGGSMNDPLASRPLAYQYPDSWLHPETLPDVNWQKAIYQVAPIQNCQLTASGGGEIGNFLLSGSYMKQDGIMKYTGYQRVNFRLNVTLNISKRLKVGMNIAPSFSSSNNPDDEGKGSSAIDAANMAPIVPLNLNTEEWGYMPGLAYTLTNPLERLKEVKQETTTNRILSNVWAELNITNSLIFRSQYGLNYRDQRSSYFKPSNVNQGDPSYGTASSFGDNDWTFQNTLTYKPKVSSVFDMDLLLGQSAEASRYRSESLTKTDYANSLITTLNVASTPLAASSDEYRNSMASFFGRFNLNVKGRYLLTINLRHDGSSKFGKDTKWGLFPSVSAGWKINSESFMQDAKWIDLLKIRASVGKAGNNNIGNYGSISSLGISNYSLNGNLVNGLAPSSIANPDLGWETKISKVIGLDFNAFTNRIQANIDYYIDDTKDMLLNVNIPYISGYSSTLQNIGKVQNRGWEIELTSHNIKSNFDWTSSFNISKNTNEVKQLGPDNAPIFMKLYGSNTTITKVGAPIGSFYMFKSDGLLLDKDFDTNGNPLVPIYPGQEKGNLKIVDINKDGKINDDDKTIVGSNQPDFIWGLTNRFSYKNFDLSILIQAIHGGKVAFMASRNLNTGDAWGVNQYAWWTREWRPTNELPLPTNSNVDMSWNGKTPLGLGEKFPNWTDFLFLSDGSYVRVKNISLGYNLPPALCKRVGLKSARFYITGDNVFTFTDYMGVNPETNTDSKGNSTTAAGIDYGTYPISRKYSIGINITF